MLVLGMKVNDSITVVDHGVVTCVAIRSNQIKIGFEFPREYRIVRTVLLERHGDDIGDPLKMAKRVGECHWITSDEYPNNRHTECGSSFAATGTELDAIRYCPNCGKVRT